MLQAMRASERQAQSTPAQRSKVDELAKLAELRDQGVLTEEEFQLAKRKLLGDGF